MPLEFYGEITRYAREYGIRVILDTAGDALNRTVGKGVYLLKPNLRELELFAGEKIQGEAHIREACRRLIAEGLAEVLVVSMGAAGAALVTEADYLHVHAPVTPIASKVGAGRQHGCGIVLGLAQGRNLADAVRLGVAAGNAAVMTPGTQLCRKEDAFRLYELIAASA